jgi:hypothetical protein
MTTHGTIGMILYVKIFIWDHRIDKTHMLGLQNLQTLLVGLFQSLISAVGYHRH